MNDNKNKKPLPENNEEQYKGKLYAYIAMGLAAAGLLFFGLSFTVMGIYALIASVIFYLGAFTFINIQKKKYDFKWLIYVKVVTYALFLITFLFFAGGILWSAE